MLQSGPRSTWGSAATWSEPLVLGQLGDIPAERRIPGESALAVVFGGADSRIRRRSPQERRLLNANRKARECEHDPTDVLHPLHHGHFRPGTSPRGTGCADAGLQCESRLAGGRGLETGLPAGGAICVVSPVPAEKLRLSASAPQRLILIPAAGRVTGLVPYRRRNTEGRARLVFRPSPALSASCGRPVKPGRWSTHWRGSR